MRRYRDYDGEGEWPRYVPVAERRADAAAKLKSLRKKGPALQPVVLSGQKIANTFWGKAWCKHLESYRDYDNRLPRGRSYLRNGSLLHLEITAGKVTAQVCGSRVYHVQIRVQPLEPAKWKAVIDTCAGQIDSMIELLQGRLSDPVMRHLTHPERGLFPLPKHIKLSCTCPDWADVCKHVAATLYGVGSRLDQQPELLFLLRGVSQSELFTAGIQTRELSQKALTNPKTGKAPKSDDLSKIFGIELAGSDHDS